MTLDWQGTAEEHLVRLTGQGGFVAAGKAPEATTVAGLDPGSPEKEAKAQEILRRNQILKAMRRVPEATLPHFQDLPVSP